MLNAQRDECFRSTTPLVTIVTPTYNQAFFLRKTIESIQQQTYRNIEYIVINDGSTDNTESVLRELNGEITWYSKSNSGQANTLNEGWEQASGKYIGYLSSDDLLRPRAIAHLVEYMEAHPECVCVYPDSDLIDASGRIIKKNVCRAFDLHDLVVRQECYIGPGAIFRKDAFLTAGGWDASLKLAPDREFWMRIAELGSFHFLDTSLAEYRLHGESLSYTLTSFSATVEYLKVLDKYYLTCVDPILLARRNEAYGFAYYLMARNALREGKIGIGVRFYLKACKLHKSFYNPVYVGRLVRNVVSKPLRVLSSRTIRKIRNV